MGKSLVSCFLTRGVVTQRHGSQRVRLRCKTTKVRISPQTVVSIATVIMICSLEHGLRTFTAVSRSTQPCIPPGSLNRVPASAGVNTGTSFLPGGR